MKNLFLIALLTLFFGVKSLTLHTSAFFQDPARTSDNRKVNPERNLDGSGGRYKGDHKHANGKKFATKKKHVKTVKPKGDNGKEKQSSQPKEEKGG